MRVYLCMNTNIYIFLNSRTEEMNFSPLSTTTHNGIAWSWLHVRLLVSYSTTVHLSIWHILTYTHVRSILMFMWIYIRLVHFVAVRIAEYTCLCSVGTDFGKTFFSIFSFFIISCKFSMFFTSISFIFAIYFAFLFYGWQK